LEGQRRTKPRSDRSSSVAGTMNLPGSRTWPACPGEGSVLQGPDRFHPRASRPGQQNDPRSRPPFWRRLAKLPKGARVALHYSQIKISGELPNNLRNLLDPSDSSQASTRQSRTRPTPATIPKTWRCWPSAIRQTSQRPGPGCPISRRRCRSPGPSLPPSVWCGPCY
jgi:hypothetical protein